MRSASTCRAAASLLILNLLLLPLSQTAVASSAQVLTDSLSPRSVWLAPNNLGAFVRKLVAGRAACLEAGVEQAHTIRDRAPNLPLTTLPPSDSQQLKIILRGTTGGIVDIEISGASAIGQPLPAVLQRGSLMRQPVLPREACLPKGSGKCGSWWVFGRVECGGRKSQAGLRLMGPQRRAPLKGENLTKKTSISI